MSGTAALGGVFVSSFLSSTLLPGSSEVVLAAVLLADGSLWWLALAVATAGNTFGGLTTYGLGRLAPEPRGQSRALIWLQRFGPAVLLLSWLPVVGDGLCLAAGWLRLRFWLCLVLMAVGKFARYVLLASLLEEVWHVALR